MSTLVPLSARIAEAVAKAQAANFELGQARLALTQANVAEVAATRAANEAQRDLDQLLHDLKKDAPHKTLWNPPRSLPEPVRVTQER